eukprot:GFYU01017177.1.p1 GENE.GFYU01017177.1~~GFYU01017177.1.p1  ORF type:complete len:144 (-),score=26.15 GFYU01017177.1:235-642(-)
MVSSSHQATASHQEEVVSPATVETLEATTEAPDVKATTATPEVVAATQLIQEDMVSATTADDDTPPTRTPVAEEEENVPHHTVCDEPTVSTPTEPSAMWKVVEGLVKKARRDLDEDGHFVPLVITGLAASAMFMK